MAQKSSKSTAFYCTKCKRRLKNHGPKSKPSDTVSFTEKKDTITFRHDGCGGVVSAG